MCGRTTLTITPGDLEKAFGFPVPAGYRPSYNIAPTQPLLALSESRGARALRQYRWGLVPYWASDIAIGSRMINARAETLATRSAFREPYARRRCLIIVDGYYEWMKHPSGKIPHRVRAKGGGPFTLAGVWDRWRHGDELVESCAIVTTAAAPQLRTLHDRMPLIIEPHDRERWVSRATPLDELPPLLAPYAGDDLEMYEVSTFVNRPGNDSEACIEPVIDGEATECDHAPASGVREEGGEPSRRRMEVDSLNYSLFSDLDSDSDGSV